MQNKTNQKFWKLNLNSCQKGRTEYFTFDGSRLVTVDLSPVTENEGSISSVGVGKEETNELYTQLNT